MNIKKLIITNYKTLMEKDFHDALLYISNNSGLSRIHSSHAYERLSDLEKKLKSQVSFFYSGHGDCKPGVKIGPISVVVDVNTLLSIISSKQDYIQQLSSIRTKFFDLLYDSNKYPTNYLLCLWNFLGEVVEYTASEVCTVSQVLKNQLRLIRRLMAEFRRKIVTCFVLDLRQFFRNKIRFLFKNMDDSSDDVLNVKHLNTLSKIIIPKNEQQRNSNSFTRLA